MDLRTSKSYFSTSAVILVGGLLGRKYQEALHLTPHFYERIMIIPFFATTSVGLTYNQCVEHVHPVIHICKQ